MLKDITKRSTGTEMMDDLQMEGELLRRSLDKLASINKWLGGNRITINGLKTLLKKTSLPKSLTILDIGCGDGDMLRIIANYMRQIKQPVQLIGIDANAFTINYAKKKSEQYPEISYLCEMIPSEAFSNLSYDILLSTLFLHHFKNEQILAILGEGIQKSRIGIIVNDLHRSNWAYFLFNVLTFFIPNPMIRQDGLTSILRGFKKTELQAFTDTLQLNDSQIQWRWAFRYQWIIKCN